MKRAVGLLSGGLDSTLAVKLMLNQGVEVFALNFITPFCTCTRKGCKFEAKRVAEKFGIKLRVVNLGSEYIEIVKNPKYGYGKNMNPCIDCRILMFSKAREYMEEIGGAFVFTGEVLGERPMSQRLDALRVIERESGLDGRLLRPLSAKLLKPTIPELKGLIDREKLLSICGRSRKPQMRLAEELDIGEYPCPAGGCRLTDPQFARRVKDAFTHKEYELEDVNFLRYGRHFRLSDGTKVIVGRNKNENLILSKFAKKEDRVLEVVGCAGPVTIIRRDNKFANILTAASICARYSDSNGKVEVRYDHDKTVTVEPISEDELQKYRI
jgi:tRNA U34 2-thiouridine synthase MnmA/TrmU